MGNLSEWVGIRPPSLHVKSCSANLQQIETKWSLSFTRSTAGYKAAAAATTTFCCILRLQAEYRQKRRRYLKRFDGVPPDLFSPDLVDYASLPASSSSSGDPDGAPSSPGVVVTVSRQNSVGSGDAFVDVRPTESGSRLAARDGEYLGRDIGRDDADGWSMMSLPGGRLVGDPDHDGRSTVVRRSVSASDPNFQTHYASLIGIDDATAASESPVLADILPAPDVEELDLDSSETETIIRDCGTTITADGMESTGHRVKSMATTPTDTHDLERGPRRSLSSSSLSPQHQRLSAADKWLVDKLLLNTTELEAS